MTHAEGNRLEHEGIPFHLLEIGPFYLPGHILQVVKGIEDNLEGRPLGPQNGIHSEADLGKGIMRLFFQRIDRYQQSHPDGHAQCRQDAGIPMLPQTPQHDSKKLTASSPPIG